MKEIINSHGWENSFPQYNKAQILIVGTIPSDEGIKNKFYYSSKKNHMYEILDYIFATGKQFHNAKHAKINNNDDKCLEDLLKKYKIMFNDVYSSVDKHVNNSSDSQIINGNLKEANDFYRIFDENKAMGKVICNSKLAYKEFIKIMQSAELVKIMQQDEQKSLLDYGNRKIKVYRAQSPSGRNYRADTKDKINQEWKKIINK